MPELPEVETVCRVLSKNIIGLTIKKVAVINKNLRYPLSLSIKKKIFQSTSILKSNLMSILGLASGVAAWLWGGGGDLAAWQAPYSCVCLFLYVLFFQSFRAFRRAVSVGID